MNPNLLEELTIKGLGMNNLGIRSVMDPGTSKPSTAVQGFKGSCLRKSTTKTKKGDLNELIKENNSCIPNKSLQPKTRPKTVFASGTRDSAKSKDLGNISNMKTIASQRRNERIKKLYSKRELLGIKTESEVSKCF